jgi:hypothetical protein
MSLFDMKVLIITNRGHNGLKAGREQANRIVREARKMGYVLENSERQVFVL